MEVSIAMISLQMRAARGFITFYRNWLMCRCVVIEDSQIGLRAAKAAGMRCIVTESRYTAGEDFEPADAVVDCIGDAGEERFSLGDLVAPGKILL